MVWVRGTVRVMIKVGVKVRAIWYILIRRKDVVPTLPKGYRLGYGYCYCYGCG